MMLLPWGDSGGIGRGNQGALGDRGVLPQSQPLQNTSLPPLSFPKLPCPKESGTCSLPPSPSSWASVPQVMPGQQGAGLKGH